ncbi:MAG: 6-bladed beta-propeller [bacterium]|nr:6-bladed beta-propeller [bacterium]
MQKAILSWLCCLILITAGCAYRYKGIRLDEAIIPNYVPVISIGRLGLGQTQFDHPNGLALDNKGNLYVTDLGNHRVQVFDRAGRFKNLFYREGVGVSSFKSPAGIAVFNRRIYVVDRETNILSEFTIGGDFLTARPHFEWVKEKGGETAQEHFIGLNSVTLDKAGALYGLEGDRAITCDGKHIYLANIGRVQKLTIPDLKVMLEFGQWGKALGEFRLPQGIAVGPEGRIFVADTLNNRIQFFDRHGNFLGVIGQYGEGPGEFYHPTGIVVNDQEEVWVADYDNHRLQKFIPKFKVELPTGLEGQESAYIYHEGRRLLTLHRYHKAIAYFSLLVESRAELSDKAQFYIGEAWQGLKESEEAFLAYDRLIRNYPASNKIAAALLKKGDMAGELGLLAEAKEAYQQILTRFPGEYLLKERAKRRLKSLGE